MKKYTTYLSLTFAVLFLSVSMLQAQVELSTGVDFVNRYVWRGLDIANTPSAQPSITLSAGGFAAGFWGAYTLTNQASGADATDEIDIWMSYGFETETAGTFGLLLTDYTFPNNGIPYGNFNDWDNADGPGAHLLELGVTYAGPESFPISILLAKNVYNEQGKNTYFELGYDATAGDLGLHFYLGGTPGSSDNPGYYGAEKFSIINLGMKVSKEIKISDSFSLPVFSSITLNPALAKPYFIIGISL